MKFYTNVTRHKNDILVRTRDSVTGKCEQYKERYQPYLFLQGKGEYKTLDGTPVLKYDFDSMYEAHEFMKRYSDVGNFGVYGMTDFVYPFIYDKFHDMDYNAEVVDVCNLDIETEIKGGFPDISVADNEITAITMHRRGIYTVLGCGDFTNHRDDVRYVKCQSEKAMLYTFLDLWKADGYPDVVTGWNTEFFDIPYLYNRICRVIGEDHAQFMSPWQVVRPYEIESRGKTQIGYTLVGINQLDYIALYKKFTYSQQESYKLDHIAFVELGENKIDYSEYGNLQALYEQNYQLYIEYNIRDVELVHRLDQKMKLLELVYAMAYDAKCNFTDTLGTVKQWDVIIHGYLMDKKIVIPQMTPKQMLRDLVGGHVKQPKIGLSKWVVSFDLTSLYPHLIMQYNISPETFRGKASRQFSIEDVIADNIHDITEEATHSKCSVTANACLYTNEYQGFLPAIMERMFNDRSKYKKLMIDAQKRFEATGDESIKNEISKYNNFQMAKKIQLNSAYGSLGNLYCRWFNFNNAEAITTSGQLSIRWIEDRINALMNKIMKTTDVDYVIASDTDSVYITMDALVQEVFNGDDSDKDKIVDFLDKVCKKKLESYIDMEYGRLATHMNAFAQKMQMKREAIALKGIWKAKKMYVLSVADQEGVRYAKPKLKMMGIEAVRSSTPSSCRKAIKDALEVIMSGDEPDLHSFVGAFRRKFMTLPFEEVAFPRGVNDINKWQEPKGRYKKGTPINVKGAITYNWTVERLDLGGKYQPIYSGDKIKFSYLIMPNRLKEEVISCPNELPPEFKIDDAIDYNKQFDKAFLDPIRAITNTIGWTPERVSNLDQWFQ